MSGFKNQNEPLVQIINRVSGFVVKTGYSRFSIQTICLYNVLILLYLECLLVNWAHIMKQLYNLDLTARLWKSIGPRRPHTGSPTLACSCKRVWGLTGETQRNI